MYFICDAEFTGLDPIRNDLLEVCILVADKNYNLIDSFYSQVRPELINDVTWESEAQQVHGISKRKAKTFPRRRDFCISLLWFLKPYLNSENIFVCHALPEKFFDKRRGQMSWRFIDYYFLEWAFRKENLQWSFWKIFSCDKLISTIQLARKHSGEYRGHSLDKWVKVINFDLNHHTAESDAMACYELFKFFKSDNEFKLGEVL